VPDSSFLLINKELLRIYTFITIDAILIAIKKLLAAIEYFLLSIVMAYWNLLLQSSWKDLKVCIDDISIAIHINWGVVTYNVSCLRVSLISWRI
jgi:hypothetical protein